MLHYIFRLHINIPVYTESGCSLQIKEAWKEGHESSRRKLGSKGWAREEAMVTESIHSFLILHHGLVLFSLERRPVWPKHDLVYMIRVQHSLAGMRETLSRSQEGLG